MIKKVLHQIWNERKQNAWLFLELFVVSLFVWLSIDPIVDLVSRSNIPQNYDNNNVYRIKFNKHLEGSTKYDPKLEDKQCIGNAYMQCINIIKEIPEIEAHSIAFSYPASGSGFEGKCCVDSTQRADGKKVTVPMKYYYAYDYNFFKTYRIKDAKTGKVVEHKGEIQPGIMNGYISELAAMELFGTTDCVGEEFYDAGDKNFRWKVMGVIENFQYKNYDEHLPIMVVMERLLTHVGGDYLFMRTWTIRLKDGVDADKFVKRFTAEVQPKLNVGNYYCSGIELIQKEIESATEIYGINNLYRQNIILSLFALLCGFMGIFGTFWLRASARRREIGIMQSIGATRTTIVRQFVTEAVMLSTVAFVLALPLVTHKVYVSGFAHPLEGYLRSVGYQQGEYLHSQPLPRFAVVTIASYLFVVLISIIGAIIPTAATVKERPADALRE